MKVLVLGSILSVPSSCGRSRNRKHGSWVKTKFTSRHHGPIPLSRFVGTVSLIRFLFSVVFGHWHGVCFCCAYCGCLAFLCLVCARRITITTPSLDCSVAFVSAYHFSAGLIPTHSTTDCINSALHFTRLIQSHDRRCVRGCNAAVGMIVTVLC